MGYVITRNGKPVRLVEPTEGSVVHLLPDEDVREVPQIERRPKWARIADALEALVALEQERNRLIVVGHERAAAAEAEQARRFEVAVAAVAPTDEGPTPPRIEGRVEYADDGEIVVAVPSLSADYPAIGSSVSIEERS